MTERADFLVNNRSPRYLHGFQKDTNETTELPHTVPVDNQVTYTDSFTNYGVDTVYGKEYVIAAGSSPTVHNSLPGRSDADTHPASSITNTPAGNIAATTVQAALNELDSEKAQLAGTLTNQRVTFSNASGFLTDNANFYYVAGTGLRVLDTTVSTSTNAGALVVRGSIGVGSGVYAEGNMTARGGTIRCGNPTFVGSATVGIDSASGRVRQFIIYSADIARWSFRVDASAETGSEAGSNLTIRAFTDAGGLVDDPITIVRAAGGNLTSPRPIRFTNSNVSTSTTTGALVVSGGVGCGDYFTGKYRSSDGSAGLTATRTFYAASTSGGAVNVLNTVTIKDGIITAWTQA